MLIKGDMYKFNSPECSASEADAGKNRTERMATHVGNALPHQRVSKVQMGGDTLM